MSKILILDVETSGLTNHPIYGHPQVIELAYLDVSSITFKELKHIKYKELPSHVSLYKPSMEIHPEAIKIHGKTRESLSGRMPSEQLRLPENIKYIIAHNATYDVRCLNRKDVSTICTLNIVKTLRKFVELEPENNKLDTLIDSFFPEEAKEFQGEFHRALDDCFKVVLLLKKLEELMPTLITWEDVYEFQNKFKGK